PSYEVVGIAKRSKTTRRFTAKNPTIPPIHSTQPFHTAIPHSHSTQPFHPTIHPAIQHSHSTQPFNTAIQPAIQPAIQLPYNCEI
ncbi:MAG: hypothetical protein SO068_08920, partial [Sodaliphilus sp.]|nr:hypothetical protein [Sodaliphilus sp.]